MILTKLEMDTWKCKAERAPETYRTEADFLDTIADLERQRDTTQRERQFALDEWKKAAKVADKFIEKLLERKEEKSGF